MKNLKLNSFRRDEGGSITAFLLTIFLLMVVAGGMAVDFMRHESERVVFQEVLDRAVLATASFDSQHDTESEVYDVVLSHFVAAGYDTDYMTDLKIYPTITAGYRRVDVSANFEIRTFFLRIINKPTLALSARATAETSRGDLELSLVVDVSYSMNARPQICTITPGHWEEYIQNTRWGPRTRQRWVEERESCVDNMAEPRKIDALKNASTMFLEEFMFVSAGDRETTSLSLVPFSGQVEPGKAIIDQFTGVNQWHQYSHCIDFDGIPDNAGFFNGAFGEEAGDSHFLTTAMDPTDEYFQAETWYTGFLGNPNMQWCPQSNNAITPLSSELGSVATGTGLLGAIDALEVEQYTAIWLGAKWGAALLDPSMQSVVTGLITYPDGAVVDARFQGRPSRWTDGDFDAKKYLILMTDGDNTKYRTVDPDHYAMPHGRDIGNIWRTQANADWWEGRLCDLNGNNCVDDPNVNGGYDRRIQQDGGNEYTGTRNLRINPVGYDRWDDDWNGYGDWIKTMDSAGGPHAGFGDDRLSNLCADANALIGPDGYTVSPNPDGAGFVSSNGSGTIYDANQVEPKITVFTIGFDISADSNAAVAMLDCASKPSFNFLAENEDQLREAFAAIAASIQKLKLVVN